MRGICATGLAVLLCCQPIVATAGGVGEGPLSRAVSRQAGRLAAESTATQKTPDWRTLRSVKEGTQLIVTTATATIRGAFVAISDSTLTVRIGDSTEPINAEDVLVIAARVRRGSAGAAVLGTLGGIWLGSALALGLAENSRCSSGCAGVRLAVWSAIIGVPTAGGYGAWYQSSRMTEEVLYRRQ